MKKYIVPILLGIAVLFIGLAVYKYMKREEKPVSMMPEDFMVGNDKPCPGETKTLELQDVYMKPYILKGQKFKVITNYYACNPIQRGDYVLHRISSMMAPVVKIVRGIPGDRFKLTQDKEFNAWNLWVNGEKLMSSDGRQHFFGGPMPPPMALYEKAQKGVLQPQDYIIMSSWAPGDLDSGIFGVMSLKDCLGKVEVVDGQEGAEPKPESDSATKETAPKEEVKKEAKAGEEKAAPAAAPAAKPAAKPAAPAKAAPAKSGPKPAPKAKK